ncbi:Gas1-like protein [Metarhizium album ARSEF 1941]|uniref:Gas1-like protein n=1 Tax=Metarhizium album (strain ARSEF 1941) TaxID=1081103 RepID=A0A0B2WN70_METAS|nr:Gas1-like protein [Metarhizium album ARSEF 1941]KHN97511.1 Gas1-like protein [Metarhizium album ARSEF 1941]
MRAKALCNVIIYSAAVLYAAAHCVIVDTAGSASKARGYGMGADLGARRDGSGTAFQRDTTVFSQTSLSAAKGCGKTHMQADRKVRGAPGYDPVLAELNNDIAASIEKMATQGAIPAAYPGTLVNITFHQVNQDGAGPFRCALDEAATGVRFAPDALKITNQVPGVKGVNGAAMLDAML